MLDNNETKRWKIKIYFIIAGENKFWDCEHHRLDCKWIANQVPCTETIGSTFLISTRFEVDEPSNVTSHKDTGMTKLLHLIFPFLKGIAFNMYIFILENKI